jgi:hypothetical protein
MHPNCYPASHHTGDLNSVVGEGIVDRFRWTPGAHPMARSCQLRCGRLAVTMRRRDNGGIGVLAPHIPETEPPKRDPVRVLVHGGGAAEPALAAGQAYPRGSGRRCASLHGEHPQHGPGPRRPRAVHRDPLVSLGLDGPTAVSPERPTTRIARRPRRRGRTGTSLRARPPRPGATTVPFDPEQEQPRRHGNARALPGQAQEHHAQRAARSEDSGSRLSTIYSRSSGSWPPPL